MQGPTAHLIVSKKSMVSGFVSLQHEAVEQKRLHLTSYGVDSSFSHKSGVDACHKILQTTSTKEGPRSLAQEFVAYHRTGLKYPA